MVNTLFSHKELLASEFSLLTTVITNPMIKDMMKDFMTVVMLKDEVLSIMGT